MSSNNVNEDLRSIKTKKALYDAMFILLKKSSFRKITIKEICEVAYISRAAFYAHFIDKYDLLQHWLEELLSNDLNISNYEQFEILLNEHTNENKLILTNLVYEADNETFLIIYNFLLSAINLDIQKNSDLETYNRRIVLANFYAGGILSYLLWQVKNNFPTDIPMMNEELYQMISEFKKWSDNIGGGFK